MPGITELLDSDMDTNNFVDENSLISSVSDNTTIAQEKEARKPRRRARVGMPKKAAPRKSPETATQSKPRATGAKRKAGEPDEPEEADLVETQPVKRRGRAPKTIKTAKTTTKTRDAANPTDAKTATRKKPCKKEPAEQAVVEGEDVPSPVAIRSNLAQTKRPVPRPVAAAKAKPAARRQQKTAIKPVEETESEVEADEGDELVEQQPPRKRMRTESRVRQEPTARRRAGSVSDTERGDPLLRRKLGDITRRFENVDMKYRNLKDAAVSEANDNVEKMRRQCEAMTEASDKLVASLKQQLATQAPLIQESRKIKKNAQTQEAEVVKLRKANADLSSTLAAAQNEIKSLQTKLVAARATPAPPEVKQPSTAARNAAAVKAIMPANGENDKLAQLKIDLYGDLTGLIIRSVKQNEDGDTYDCIQTGRNGTLHFKLFVDAENAKRARFEETEFLYTPLLDANRDRDLIEIMPDYLTEDITFEREVAAKFYARVVKTLTERPAYEEEE